MSDLPTTSSLPPPDPANAVPSLHQRRIYFEHLASLLLASGFSGDKVGRLVAELDEHVALAGVDPVDELGPVGELAEALKVGVGVRRLAFVVGLAAASSAAVGLALAFVLGLQTWRSGGAVEIPLSVVAQTAGIGTGVMLLRSFGSRSVQGRRTLEFPGWRPFLLYLIGVGALVALTAGRVWVVSPGIAVAAAVITAAVGGLGLWWMECFQRVRIPGAAGHLERLHWGWLGR